MDRKDPETKKRQPFEVGAKIGKIVKNPPFPTQGAAQAAGVDFCRFRPGFKGLPFARPWVFSINFFFFFESSENLYPIFCCGIEHISIFDMLWHPQWHNRFYTKKCLFFAICTHFTQMPFFCFFEIFTKNKKKTFKGRSQLPFGKKLSANGPLLTEFLIFGLNLGKYEGGSIPAPNVDFNLF